MPESLIRATISEGHVYNPVSMSGFNGGYITNVRLPYLPEDFVYYDSASDVVVLMSGVLYNKQELAPIAGVSPDTPDPELISRLFILQGTRFAEKVNGDFAIAIALPGKEEAYLFRDHAGIRPVAYAFDEGRLFFSSDINGLSWFISKGTNIDSEYIAGFFRYIDNRLTPCTKVLKLLPGHYLHLHGRQIEINRYWDPSAIVEDNTLTHGRMLEDLSSLLGDAVKIRCDSRFNAGAHVSGGLDSGIVAALARDIYKQQEKFYGFSWSPERSLEHVVGDDERDLIERFCNNKRITPVFSDITVTGYLNSIAASEHNRLFCFETRTLKQASERGVNLLFSGWGGDDFISTGDRGIEIDLLRGLHLRTFFRRNPLRHLRSFMRDFLKYVIYPLAGIYDPAVSGFMSRETKYLRHPIKRSDRKIAGKFYFHSSRRNLHLNLLDFYHIQDRCELWSIGGFRSGVEYRYPLLDKRIIEYVLKIPSVLLCQTGQFRPLLRELGEGVLPDEIRMRTVGTDKTYWSYLTMLNRESAESLLEMVPAWKENRDLHFVDYDLLMMDIERFRGGVLGSSEDIFLRSLVNLGAAHAFTVNYRKEI